MKFYFNKLDYKLLFIYINSYIKFNSTIAYKYAEKQINTKLITPN